MDEQRLKLLNRGVLVLPENIDHSTYELVLEALMLKADEEVQMYCRGNGGDSASAIAIVDLIDQHGNVVGLLPGEAASNHATIWAACQQRFVYPRGCLSLHKVARHSLSSRVDSQSLRLMAEDYERVERVIADILAEASNRSAAFWYNLLQETGSGGLYQFEAKRLIEMEMAKPIAERAERLVPA